MKVKYSQILVINDMKALENKKVNLEERNPDKLEGEEKKNFLKGAEIAYETIITSFAKGIKKS